MPGKKKPAKAKKKPAKAKKKPAKKPARAAAGPPSLRGCDLVFEIDEDAPDVRAAVQALRRGDRAILRAAEPHVVAYCEDILARAGDDAPEITLRRPSDVWRHVRLGGEMMVQRRARGDAEDGVYFSLECNCDWEPEHAMQLVIRDGKAVTKVSGYDGHLTNSGAYADPRLVGVVYRRIGS